MTAKARATRKKSPKRGDGRRIVAKFGTSLLTGGGERLDRRIMSGLIGQVARIRDAGNELIVVSSGAIAAGRERLGSPNEKRATPLRQVLAAIGQSHLMQTYDRLFAKHGLLAAQALLTRNDLVDRVGYLNARNTLLALLEAGATPIVNENDVVAVEEIEGTAIGDNDNLSALVANLVDADLLVILTDTGGLHTADPRRNPDAKLVIRVERVTPEVEQLADDSATPHGVGGMITKLQAAKLATAGGATVVVASGREKNALERIAGGESLGTLFPATSDRIESRKRWMLSGLSARGRIVVDGGAAKALRSQGRSLLPAGVKEVVGPFDRGDTVSIYVGERPIAIGITNYGHDDAKTIAGLRSDRIEKVLGHEHGVELIHRNNLVLL